MKVDFYQLSRDPVERVVPQLARKVLEMGERLLIVAADPDRRAAISEGLWTVLPDSFLAHGDAAEAAVQPILLADSCEAANGARYIMLADGQWREDALGFERCFHLFDNEVVEAARNAWRRLAKAEGVEPRFWRQSGGKWIQAA